MKKAAAIVTALFSAVIVLCTHAHACTNFIVTRGASTDGSVMIT